MMKTLRVESIAGSRVPAVVVGVVTAIASYLVATTGLSAAVLVGALGVAVALLVAAREFAVIGLAGPALAAVFQGRYTWLAVVCVLPLCLALVPRSGDANPADDDPATPRADQLVRFALLLMAGLTLVDAARTPNLAVAGLVQLAVLGMAAALAARYFHRFGVPARTARAVVASGTVVAAAYVVSIGPVVASGGTHVWVFARAATSWANPNTLGLYFLVVLAVPLHAIATGHARPSTWICTALLVGGTAMTFSRSAYLGFAAMVLVLVARSRRALLLVGPPVALAMANLPVAMLDRIQYTSVHGALDASSTVRLDLWAAAWRIALDHPIVGVGVPALPAAFAAHGVTGHFAYAHNSYLTLLAGTGLIAPAVLAVALVMRAVRRSRPGGSAVDGEPDPGAPAGGQPVHPSLSAFALALVAVAVCSFFGEPLLSPIAFVPFIAVATISTISTNRSAPVPDGRATS